MEPQIHHQFWHKYKNTKIQIQIQSKNCKKKLVNNCIAVQWHHHHHHHQKNPKYFHSRNGIYMPWSGEKVKKKMKKNPNFFFVLVRGVVIYTHQSGSYSPSPSPRLGEKPQNTQNWKPHPNIWEYRSWLPPEWLTTAKQNTWPGFLWNPFSPSDWKKRPQKC